MLRHLFAVVVFVSAGCADTMSIGRDFDASRGDAARSRVQSDSCGNGIDDDQNGLIDDGCPCGVGEIQSCFEGAHAQRGGGMCRDGIQTCVAEGVEWGDWGDAPCVGSTLPQREQCTGLDSDCDGAVDEGCPCTVGEMRRCGADTVRGECRDGIQTCGATGSWSHCTGAISPQSEVCGNSADEDCDGATDESCGCIPDTEICEDGIDNDCDNVIDEPACAPDWPVDGGMPIVCTGDLVCFEAQSAARDATRITYGAQLVATAIENDLLVAYGDRWGSSTTAIGDGMLHLTRLASNGTVLANTTIGSEPLARPGDGIDPQSGGVSSILPFESDIIVQYEVDRDPRPNVQDTHVPIGRFELSGTAVHPPVELGARARAGAGHLAGGMVRTGEHVLVVHATEQWSRVAAGRYDPEMNTYEESLTLSGTAMRGAQWSLASNGTTAAVVTFEERSLEGGTQERRSFVTFMRDGAILETQTIDGAPTVEQHPGDFLRRDHNAVVAWGADRFLVCWTRLVGPSREAAMCRAFSDTGTPLSAAFQVVAPLNTTPRHQVLTLSGSGDGCAPLFLTFEEFLPIEIDAVAGTARPAIARVPADRLDVTWQRAIGRGSLEILELRTSSASGLEQQVRVWISGAPQIACIR